MAAEERYGKAKKIFSRALTLDGSERGSYIERACAGDELLRQEVEGMLASDQQSNDLWEANIQNQVANGLTAVYGSDDKSHPAEQLLNDRYIIQEVLGQGGVGIVYRAIDLQVSSRPVAIKMLREDVYKTKGEKEHEYLKRKFLQEAEALSRIRHPGVVMILDRGGPPDGRPFLVMEWVEGRPLRDAIKPYGMAFGQVAGLVRQMGQALTAVHNQNVFHRDLKPENTMLQSLGEGEEQVKLIDFGIAKVKDSEVGPETSFNMIAGTILYLAPEQLIGQKVTAATDIYAFGVIAYEMLTGRWPFNPTSEDPRVAIQQILSMQQMEHFLKPRDLRRDLPELAERAILRALSFDPALRHSRAKDFGEELAHALLEMKTDDENEGRVSHRPMAELKPELAHVLFMDVVAYSTRPMSKQREIVNQLQDIVRNARIVKQARDDHQVIILFTGDGMALGFFGEPTVSLECAKEIARATQSQNEFELRMGLHTGPVYRIEDINANKNMAGGGINIAQRVMDCGDAGHILCSNIYADYFIQLGDRTQHLSDLGEYEAKNGLKLHLFNFYDGEVGNPNTPKKLLRNDPPPPRDDNWKMIIAVCAIIIIGGAFIWMFGSVFKTNSGLTTKNTVSEVETTSVLNYSLTAQTHSGNKPVGNPIEMYREMDGAIYFRGDDRLRFRFASPQAGYLYLLNEGPEPSNDGKPIYHVMFPSTEDNNASARIEANQSKIVPREADPAIGFVDSTGTEKVWIIWSATPVTELEDVKRLNNPKKLGKITDSAQIDRVKEFLAGHLLSRPKVESDDANKRTSLSAAGGLLVHIVKLEHR